MKRLAASVSILASRALRGRIFRRKSTLLRMQCECAQQRSSACATGARVRVPCTMLVKRCWRHLRIGLSIAFDFCDCGRPTWQFTPNTAAHPHLTRAIGCGKAGNSGKRARACKPRYSSRNFGFPVYCIHFNWHSNIRRINLGTVFSDQCGLAAKSNRVAFRDDISSFSETINI